MTEEEKASAASELKTTLQAKLLKKATDQIPAGFILFKDATFINIDGNSVDLSAAKDNMLPIKLTGTLYGLLFDEKKLTQKIAQAKIPKFDGSSVYIPHIADLTFLLPGKENVSFADVKNITFNLSGAAKIVYQVDTEKLTADLLGKAKSDFNQVLLQYPNIESAELKVSPLWKRSIPKNSKDVSIIVNYPQ